MGYSRIIINMGFLAVHKDSAVHKNSVSRKVIFALVVFIAIVFGYLVYDTLFQFTHFYLGSIQATRSEEESKENGYYLGRYLATRTILQLRDSSEVRLSPAWVEQHWRERRNWLYQIHKESADGFEINIPMQLKSATKNWGRNLHAELERSSKIHSESGVVCGINGGAEGFATDLNTLPDTIALYIVEKPADSTWSNFVPLDSVGFILVKSF